jgi:SAM-dependent methyltransferase
VSEPPNVLSLLDLVDRSAAEPWRDGDNIPWHEPGFSKRMLAEHLSQEHDAASRCEETIEEHVGWIHKDVLAGRTTKVLDLACGPGLYASRLASMGHECVGIDYSPASIAHAKDEVGDTGLNCQYVEADIRQADYGSGFGLVMLIYGELNVFRPDDAKLILRKAHKALDPGGIIVLEPSTEEAVREIGARRPFWATAEIGLFSNRPHLRLQEASWDAEARVATTRYFIVDAEDGSVERFAGSTQAYSDEEYRELLKECGFEDIEFRPPLAGDFNDHLMILIAKKPAS